jgi:hypothetical protein
MGIETCPVCHGEKLVPNTLHAQWVMVRDRLEKPPIEKCPYYFGKGAINIYK